MSGVIKSRIKQRLFLLLSRGLIFCAILLCPNLSAWANQKYAVIIGNNLGHDPARQLRFAEHDAEKIQQVLLELGDFAPENIRLLRGGQAQDVWRNLRELEAKAKETAQRTGLRTMLLFYYSGHAEGDVLELGSSSLYFAELLNFLKASHLDVRIALIDSCESGKLVAMKGGRRAPAFEIKANDEISSSGYAIITSSADNELSQEAAEIRGSYFSHYFVSALRGAGDASKDGQVTLGEAYQYAYLRTVARTSASMGGGQHPMYDFRLAGRGEIVLTRLEHARSQLKVTSHEKSRLVVLDDRGESMIAEREIEAWETATLSLPRGRYQVFLLSRGGQQVRRAEITVDDTHETILAPDAFTSHSLEQTVSKGGLFRQSWTNRISLGALFRRMPLENGTLSYGAALSYRLNHGAGFAPIIRLTHAAAPDEGISTGYYDLGITAGLSKAWFIGPAIARLELLTGYEHLFQDDRDELSRHSGAFAYLAQTGLEVPWSAFFLALDIGAGGRVLRIVNKGLEHRFDLQLLLGVGAKWDI